LQFALRLGLWVVLWLWFRELGIDSRLGLELVFHRVMVIARVWLRVIIRVITKVSAMDKVRVR
jgi:hypothetical protein